MGNYKFTRKEAAESLDMSMRSIDRYIKAWKLRAKKKWKIVYVHTEDISNIGGDSHKKKHIIITKWSKTEWVSEDYSSRKIVKKSDYEDLTKTFENIYGDLRSQIDKITYYKIEVRKSTIYYTLIDINNKKETLLPWKI